MCERSFGVKAIVSLTWSDKLCSYKGENKLSDKHERSHNFKRMNIVNIPFLPKYHPCTASGQSVIYVNEKHIFTSLTTFFLNILVHLSPFSVVKLNIFDISSYSCENHCFYVFETKT